jgi:hypothetical protein
MTRQEERSFLKERTKELSFDGRSAWGAIERPTRDKVFLFLFLQKKKILPPLSFVP